MAILKELLEFQLKSAQELSELLEAEKFAITQKKSKKIEDIATSKLALVEQLNQTDSRIAQHPHVSSLTEDAELIALVDSIRSQIDDCKQANEINGQALERAHISFNKLKNMMQETQGKMGMTYTSTGQTRSISTLGTDLKA